MHMSVLKGKKDLLQDANAGGNFFRNMFDMYVPI